jgi:hypothetical protein
MKILKACFLCFLALVLVSLWSIAQAKEKVWTVGHGTDYDFNEDNYSAYPGAIQAAVDSAIPGDKIMVAEGNYFGATVNKPVEIKGNSDETVIISGPGHPRFGSSGFKVGFIVSGVLGAKISHLKIFCSSYPLFIGILIIKSDNTTVEHLLIQTPVEGINLFGSSLCKIIHNTVTGQLSAGYNAINLYNGGGSTWGWNGPVTDNLVAFNTIENSTGGGIYLKAAYNLPFTLNAVEHNNVNNPNGNGIVLSGDSSYLRDNVIAHNDFRGCHDEILCSSSSLLIANTFSKNLGFHPPD